MRFNRRPRTIGVTLTTGVLGVVLAGSQLWAQAPLSSGMTAVAGVFYAFYYNNLFPEQVFHISRSIEIILGPVIGGVGTLFGPILGAAVLTLLSDGITEGLAAVGWEIPGIKQVFYGLVLLAVVMFLPHGIWPAIARRLRL